MICQFAFCKVEADHKLGSEPSLRHLATRKGFGRGPGVVVSGSSFCEIRGFYRKMLDSERLPNIHVLRSQHPCYVKDDGDQKIYICRSGDYWKVFKKHEDYFHRNGSDKLPLKGWEGREPTPTFKI